MFDSNEELLAKIRLGEDSLLELKSVRWKGERIVAPARDDLADELAAFANATDGVVVLGVDDRRQIEGIPLERLDGVEALVRVVCQDSIKPPLLVHIVRRFLPDGKGVERPVLQVTVPRSLYVHLSPGGYFRRVGSSKRELSPDVLARLMQQRSQARVIRFDEKAVPETSPDTLVEPLWTRFRGEAAEEDRLVTLDKLRLVTRDDQHAWRATVAGVLMCTEHPEEWLRNAVIEAVHYGTGERDSHHQIDARTIVGPLDRQINEALFFVERNMSVAAVKAPGRIDIPQYSLRAVFEAIVNAVAHRDYAVHGSKIRLFMFPDRLELYSPGGLANTLTVESLALRQATRNELIASLLAKCPLQSRSDLGRTRIMDKRGEGVPIILRESRKLSGRTPEYLLIDESELCLTIHAGKPPARSS
jgi:predicted HTH transcriptional regulator